MPQLGPIKLTNDGLTYHRQTYPIAGAQASVSVEGQVLQKATLTRAVVTLGLGFFIWKKTKDQRIAYVSIIGPGWAITEQFGPSDISAAHQFVAAVNAQAAAEATPPM